MANCICDGPPHPYSSSWCHAGRNADPPHGPINPYWNIGASAPWDNTAYDRARDADVRGSIPRTPPPPPEAVPANKWYKTRIEARNHISYLRQTAKEYEDGGLLDEADRFKKIADFMEGII